LALLETIVDTQNKKNSPFYSLSFAKERENAMSGGNKNKEQE
jgi:hypothetical protein